MSSFDEGARAQKYSLQRLDFIVLNSKIKKGDGKGMN